MNALVQIAPSTNVEAYRASTDAAELCKEIVVASAQSIQGRKYVRVEGWQAIAVAHGCAASARDVRHVDGGYVAVGEVRRMSDGVVIAEAEGFVGEDEPTWFGGRMGSKTLPKRADYAIRAMAQTRAISRACRSAFAHVVVMMNAGLSTTPAEEVPEGGFNDDAVTAPAREAKAVRLIDHGQRDILATLAEQSGVDLRTVCTKCKIATLPDLEADKFTAVRDWLEGKLRAKGAAKAGPENPPEHAVLEDEIPY